MKPNKTTRKSLAQIQKESGKTSWGSLLSQEAKEKNASEKPKQPTPQKP